MSHRLFIRSKLVALATSLTLVFQSFYTGIAHADEADDFIKKTHQAAEGIATNTLNMLLIRAVQDAMSMTYKLETAQAVKAMDQMMNALRGSNMSLNRTFAVATDPDGKLTGKQLRQLYADYGQLMSRVSAQQLNINSLRRDMHAYRAAVYEMVDKLLVRMDQVCADGFYVNPYEGNRPVLQNLVTPYAVKLTFEIGPDGPKVDNEKSGVMLGKNDEERALWALGYAGATILSGYALTGTWILSGAAMSGLSLGMQAAILGMGLGITAAVAAVIIICMTVQARNAAAEAVRKQRRMFHERADHKTVSRLFTAKCQQARQEFSGLREEVKALAAGDSGALKRLDVERSINRDKLKEFSVTMNGYYEKQLEIMGEDFPKLTDDEKKSRQEKFAETPEAKKFAEMSKEISIRDMTGMIKFLLTDMFNEGVKHADQVQAAYERARQAIEMGRAESRMETLRELAAQQNLEEMNVRPLLKEEFKAAKELAILYAEMDQLVIDFARAIFSAGPKEPDAFNQIGIRVEQLRDKIRQATKRYPNSELLKHMSQRLNQIRGVQQRAV